MSTNEIVSCGADTKSHFVVSGTLYGREEDLRKMCDAFESVRLGGGVKLVLVKGQSGARSILVSGKADLKHRRDPLFSFSQAFRDLIQKLLDESSLDLEEWRTSLLTALGGLGRVITDVLPELESVIGPQPHVASLEPAENEMRLQMVFAAFINVFCRTGRPFVVFLDDLQVGKSVPSERPYNCRGYTPASSNPTPTPLHFALYCVTQWADITTISLITFLLSEPSTTNLLLVGAYRINEVDDGHPLPIALSRLPPAVADCMINIHLSPLPIAKVTDMLADTFHVERQRIHPLDAGASRVPSDDFAAFVAGVYGRTAGNPFFIVQLFKTLSRDGIVFFDSSVRQWRWDLEALQKLQASETVAASQLLPAANAPATHLRIARRLDAASNDPDASDAGILSSEAVAQYTSGADLADLPGERVLIAKLNFEAGTRMSDASFYDEAMAHFKTGIAILESSVPGDCTEMLQDGKSRAWVDEYPLMFALHIA
ncbi:AAA ATPase domain-containing protein, partial [Blyttiomyces helicus]